MNLNIVAQRHLDYSLFIIKAASLFIIHYPQSGYQIMLASQHSGAVRPIILTMVGATFARP